MSRLGGDRFGNERLGRRAEGKGDGLTDTDTF